MTNINPTQSNDPRELANELLERSLPEERTLDALSRGLGRAYRSLVLGLSDELGATAVRMIMERSVGKSAQKYPFLREIAVYEEDMDVGIALDQKSDQDYDELRRNFEEVLANFVQLLEGLVGRNITADLLREAIDHARGMHRKGTEGDE